MAMMGRVCGGAWRIIVRLTGEWVTVPRRTERQLLVGFLSRSDRRLRISQ